MSIDEQPGDPIADGGDESADPRGDDRRPAGLRFEGDEAERFAIRRHDSDARRPVEISQAITRGRGLEAHQVGDSELLGEVDQVVGLCDP